MDIRKELIFLHLLWFKIMWLQTLPSIWHSLLAFFVNAQQTFLVFQDVFKTSWRGLQRNTFRLPRRLQDVFAIRLPKLSSRRLARRLQDVFKTCLQDVLHLCLQDVFKTSSRHLGRQKKSYTEDVFSTSWPRRMFAGCVDIKVKV